MTLWYNRSTEKQKRKMLRSNMPSAEVMLWLQLKGKQISSYKFRRQYSVGKFVVDFYCPRLKLAIEVDGESHYHKSAASKDKERQSMIESFGITFLRFTNREIYDNMEGVLDRIMQQIEELTSPAPP